MKKEHISDALSMLDDELLAETDAVRHRKNRQKNTWRKWAGAAACLALMIYAGSRLLPLHDMPEEQTTAPDQGADAPAVSDQGPDASDEQSETPIEQPQLPMLSISEDAGDGMGFEGYLAYDSAELVNANPWSEETALTTLPVYENQNQSDGDTELNLTAMREVLLAVATRLGLEADTLTVTDDVPDEQTQQQITEKLGGVVPDGYFDPTRLRIETDGISIEVDATMTATISFEPAVSLPDAYHFAYDATYEELAAVADYLKTEYSALIGFEDPQVNVYGGDYTIALAQRYSLAFFDGSGSMAEQVVNYNLNRVEFYCDDDGNLFLVRIDQSDLSEPVGEYPLISVEEARELLSNGNYLTTAPYELPGMECVKKVELVYRTGEREDYFMPYYRFYVELPELEENGLKTYGAYYVPAVERTYLTNLPIWDGSFN